MDSPIAVRRGVRALRRLLEEQTFDLRGLDRAGFRRWLDSHLVHWRNDPVFVQRTCIRDLRRSHPCLRTLEAEHRRAADADAASSQAVRLRHLEWELSGTSKAVIGLAAALEQAAPPRRSVLQEKLDHVRTRQRALEEEQADLLRSSPTRQPLQQIDAELQQYRTAIGLDREEARLHKLLAERGRRSGKSGDSFEQQVLTLTRSHIIPDLLRGNSDDERLYILQGVTLRAARVEFDQLVIRQRDAEQPVEVLAAIEVKRNLNDLAHGFRQRQENLAWLRGEREGYDPLLYRTKRFRTGHFDRDGVHRVGEETFRFTPDSFRRFRRDADSGHFLHRLYFVTRPGMIWGVSTVALARIGYRVATEEDWEPGSEAHLDALQNWCQSLAQPIETPDVLRWYAMTPRLGRQILVVGA